MRFITCRMSATHCLHIAQHIAFTLEVGECDIGPKYTETLENHRGTFGNKRKARKSRKSSCHARHGFTDPSKIVCLFTRMSFFVIWVSLWRHVS